MPNHRWRYLGEEDAKNGRRVALTDAAGFIGFGAGPSVHYIDRWALGDPLLSRLPADVPWNIGHFTRHVPAGYVDTIESGRNVIQDVGVGAYYEKVKLITEGPIWSHDRLRAIVAMNLGRYEGWIETYGRVRAHLGDLSQPTPDGTEWNGPGTVMLEPPGLELDMDTPTTAAAISLSVSRNDHYVVSLWNAGRRVHLFRIVQPVTLDGTLVTQRIAVPTGVQFDTVRVEPSEGDALYSVGHVSLEY
jgi:arabinofuranosyltransferase